ncbi:hypothetical protein BDV96DRAFT_630425 [Lophiotrema nucula]|uniref:Uncharacterized protein n=1 Tax=Lophiotrema nucula TaxID=690887 RepID=A0A6A5ZGC0_9PLEO|nr:hypothetical protein BDV96DRAFT_630425 [Lophiotrema nucula]
MDMGKDQNLSADLGPLHNDNLTIDQYPSVALGPLSNDDVTVDQYPSAYLDPLNNDNLAMDRYPSVDLDPLDNDNITIAQNLSADLGPLDNDSLTLNLVIGPGAIRFEIDKDLLKQHSGRIATILAAREDAMAWGGPSCTDNRIIIEPDFDTKTVGNYLSYLMEEPLRNVETDFDVKTVGKHLKYRMEECLHNNPSKKVRLARSADNMDLVDCTKLYDFASYMDTPTLVERMTKAWSEKFRQDDDSLLKNITRAHASGDGNGVRYSIRAHREFRQVWQAWTSKHKARNTRSAEEECSSMLVDTVDPTLGTPYEQAWEALMSEHGARNIPSQEEERSTMLMDTIDPTLVDASLVDASLVGPSLVGPSLVGPSLVDPTLVDPNLGTPYEAGATFGLFG